MSSRSARLARFGSVLLAMGLALACTQPGPSPEEGRDETGDEAVEEGEAQPAEPDMEQLRQALQETNDEAARILESGDLAGLDAVYTADATILPPGAPSVTGREGIKAYWDAGHREMGITGAELTTVDLRRAGDRVIEIGNAEITVEAEDGGSDRLPFKYVVVWKQENGAWKWHVDIWNANPPPPEASASE